MSDREDLDYIIIERKRGGFGPFVWGAAIGAGLALLLSPRSGRQLREDLRESMLRARNEAESAVRGVQRSVTDTVGGVREDVRGRLDAARDAFEAGRRAARESSHRGSEPMGRTRPAAAPLDHVTDEDLDADV